MGLALKGLKKQPGVKFSDVFRRHRNLIFYTQGLKLNEFLIINPQPQPNKMAKHSDNSSAVADKLFECVWPFCEVGAKRIKKTPQILALKKENLYLKITVLIYLIFITSNPQISESLASWVKNGWVLIMRPLIMTIRIYVRLYEWTITRQNFIIMLLQETKYNLLLSYFLLVSIPRDSYNYNRKYTYLSDSITYSHVILVHRKCRKINKFTKIF